MEQIGKIKDLVVKYGEGNVRSYIYCYSDGSRDTRLIVVRDIKPEEQPKADAQLAAYKKLLEDSKEYRRKQYEAMKKEFEGK